MGTFTGIETVLLTFSYSEHCATTKKSMATVWFPRSVYCNAACWQILRYRIGQIHQQAVLSDDITRACCDIHLYCMPDMVSKYCMRASCLQYPFPTQLLDMPCPIIHMLILFWWCLIQVIMQPLFQVDPNTAHSNSGGWALKSQAGRPAAPEVRKWLSDLY